MVIRDLLGSQWRYLVSMLPADFDLEATARQTGALVRRRVIRNAEDLLWLALIYSCCGLSLRQVSSWVEARGMPKLSQVAVMKRLRGLSTWLGLLLGAKLAERTGCQSLGDLDLRLRLVDATTVSAPGSRGTDWRIHLGFRLGDQSIDSVELTGAEGGESLRRFRINERDLLIADAGYGHRSGLWSVHQAGGLFIVRTNWQNLPLESRQGEPFDLLEALRQVPDAEAAEFTLQSVATGKIPALPVRLVVLRKSAAATEEAQKRAQREAQKKGRKVSPKTLEAAGYIVLVTSVPAEQLSASQVLELYRFRWQVELAFKRMKSLLQLGELPARDPDLARTYLYAKLLAALLVEDLTQTFLSFSPWGFRLRAVPQPVANSGSAV
jgi:Transposase DDE domain